jgi:hypothetical protein
MAERDELALREALRTLDHQDTVDPQAARHRAQARRRNGLMAAGVATALLLVAGVIGIPRLPAGQGSPTAAEPAGPEVRPSAVPPPTDPAPTGWRTEYYRSISFEVPADWGYAVPPEGSWCASAPDGKPRPEQRKPYVWLRMDHPEPAIACGPMPNSLLTEHVVALEPGPAEDYGVGAFKKAGWWSVSRAVGGAILFVTTKDRHRAERILDSARAVRDPLCPPRSPLHDRLGARPGALNALTGVDQVLLCQYEPDPWQPSGELKLRAAKLVAGRAADQLVAELQSAPVNDTKCDPPPVDSRPEVAILARVWTGKEMSDISITAAGCPSSDRGMVGGIDDGTMVRLLTRNACQRLLSPPLALFAASGEVGRNCLG